jgi:DNA-binding NarL/FixJ family response regulator
LTELTAITVTLSPIVADLIASVLAARAPVAVAERFTTRRAAEAWLSHHRAELIIVGAAEAEAGDVISRFLALAPDATVLALSDDGRRARVRVNATSERLLSDVSPDQLADAVLAFLGGRG